jgi:hypothetical protein
MGRDAVFGHHLRDGEVKVLLQINQTIDWERSSAYSHYFLERTPAHRWNSEDYDRDVLRFG